MKRSFHRKRARLLLIACFVAVAAIEARAQDETPTPSAAVSPAPSPAPAAAAVPLADVVGAAETVSARLQQVESEVAANQTTADVARNLPTLAQEIGTRLEETRRSLRPGVPIETTRELEQTWRGVADQLALWTRNLTERAAFLDREIAQLPELRETWRATLEAARSAGAPAEVTQRIETVLKTIDRAEATLQKRRASILSLQSRVAGQTQRVQGALRSIEEAQDAAVTRLWVQDSPPIWSAAVRAAAAQDLVTESQASFGAQTAQLRAYLAREWAKLVCFALIVCALAFVLTGIKRRAARWTDEDPALARANRILQLPIATASVLAFLFCRPLFPQAPRLFWIILAAVALVPVVIILRRPIDRSLFPILNALVVFYVVAQLRALAATLPVLSRVILLLEMLGGAIFLLWFIRSTRGSSGGATSRRATRAAARAGVALFAFVFVTNSLGYVALSNYLGRAALATAYLAIVLYAAAGILEGLISFALQIWPLSSLKVVQRHRVLLRARLGRVIYFVAFFGWLLLSLGAFSLRRPLLDRLSAIVNAEISVRALHFSLGGVLAFALTIWVAVLISRLLRFILEEDIYDRFRVAPGTSYALTTVLHYVIVVAGFFAALAAVGVDMTKFAILAGAFGVGIGFGLQNIFNNFFSGLILLLERPIRVGDVIALGGVTGVVQRIGIRASVIRLIDGSELIVPNGQLISEKVTNRTVPSRQARIDLRVGVAYGSDPQRVIELLRGAATAHPLVAQQPPPDAFMKEFGADALLFDLVLWTDEPLSAARVQSDVAVAINAALREAGIEIPYPQRNLHVQSISAGVAEALQPARADRLRHYSAGRADAGDGA